MNYVNTELFTDKDAEEIVSYLRKPTYRESVLYSVVTDLATISGLNKISSKLYGITNDNGDLLLQVEFVTVEYKNEVFTVVERIINNCSKEIGITVSDVVKLINLAHYDITGAIGNPKYLNTVKLFESGIANVLNPTPEQMLNRFI